MGIIISSGSTLGNEVSGDEIKIPSEAEGDILYRNATEWARLPKGTAEQVIAMNAGATAPNWVGASGQWTLEETGDGNTTAADTYVGSSGMTVRDIWLLVVKIGNTSGSTCDFAMRLNADATSGNYKRTNVVGTTWSNNSDPKFEVANVTANDIKSFWIIIDGKASQWMGATPVLSTTNSDNSYRMMRGSWKGNADVTGITFTGSQIFDYDYKIYYLDA